MFIIMVIFKRFEHFSLLQIIALFSEKEVIVK